MKSVFSLQEKLIQRKENNSLRSLTTENKGIDFYSNDYLSIAKNNNISIANPEEPNYYGSSGSRLISGNYSFIEKIETEIAEFHNSPSALLYQSGYIANLGLISCIAQKNDTIIYDALIHASIRDSIKLSNAKSFSFKHNDIIDLEKKIKKSEGNIFVIIESVYSMDGDFGNIDDILAITKQHEAHLIIDEAHSVGLFGKNGQGITGEKNIINDVFAIIVTFGKSFGLHGAAILSSEKTKQYLINFSRPFIYTTGISKHEAFLIQERYKQIKEAEKARIKLFENIKYYRDQISKINFQLNFSLNNSPIQYILIGNIDQTKKIASELNFHKILVKPILSPTVPKGKERIRICLHQHNTKKEIDLLIQLINQHL
jgi:8-amino-7-oxononanoate synthase